MPKAPYFTDPAKAKAASALARPRGPNRLETDIKLMVETALHKLGGVDYLVQCGRNKHTQAAFLGLVKQIIPRNIEVGGSADILALLTGSWQRQQQASVESAQPPLVIDAQAVVRGIDNGHDDAAHAAPAAEAAPCAT